MALPLSPMANAALNAVAPHPLSRMETHQPSTSNSLKEDDFEGPPSSPFISNISDGHDYENDTTATPRSSFKICALEEKNSPIKAMAVRAIHPGVSLSLSKVPMRETSPYKLISPKKIILARGDKTPFRPSSRLGQATASDQTLHHIPQSAKSFEILEDGDSSVDYEECKDRTENALLIRDAEVERDSFADETAFSTFSAVPDMTMFSKIGQSPTKYGQIERTPTRNGNGETSIKEELDVDESSSSPTPRRYPGNPRMLNNSGNTTNLILDFTEQFNSLSGGYSHGQSSPTGIHRSQSSKSQTVPDLFTYTQTARTPSPHKNRQRPLSPSSRMSNLLDFDIPPAPTPRSMPTITPRELEGLKSGFLSEISNLKATLNGKDAEILSLKAAVSDAESRVGECIERVREELNLREQQEVEKEAWEKRGREMEIVLRDVKQEIVHGQRERDNLESKLEDSEKRREAAEILAQEVESKMAGMKAGSGDNESAKDQAGSAVNGDVEIAVERVARELHSLYKSKHETKVAALKKSYESRWDKRVKELQTRVDDLSRENEELKIGRDATMSGVVPKLVESSNVEEIRRKAATEAKTSKELQARVDGLVEELNNIKVDNTQLRSELDQERIEKGELVAACDEMLALQDASLGDRSGVTSVENLRGSISRASGLRAPNFASGSVPVNGQATESRIGKFDRNRSGSALGVRPSSGLGMRSNILSSIEKMGGYQGKS